MTAKKVKKSLTIHITQEDRNKLEDAVKSFRKRTGEVISAGKVARDESLKWAERELKKHTEQV